MSGLTNALLEFPLLETNIYLLRHGHSLHNYPLKYFSFDPTLSYIGNKEVRILGEKIKKDINNKDNVYLMCS